MASAGRAGGRWLDSTAAGGAETIAVVLLAAAAFGFVIMATAGPGPGVSHDSVAYLAAADNLRHGQGLEIWGGRQLQSSWPPLFPAVIAGVAETLGVGVLTAARIVNATALGAIVLITHALLRRHVTRMVLRLAGVVAITGAPAVCAVALFAWSEPLFIALVSGALLALERCVEAPRTWRWVLVSGALTALAGLTRYVGPTVAATGVLVLLLCNRSSLSALARFGRTTVFLTTGMLPLLIWAAEHGVESVFFSRTPSSLSLRTNVARALDTIGKWTVTHGSSTGIRVVGTGLVIASVVVVVVVLARIVLRRSGGEPSWAPLPIFTVVYLATIVIQATRVELDPIADRLLVPIVVSGGVLLFIGVDAMATALLRRRWPATAVVSALALVILWAIAPVHRSWAEANEIRHRGALYTSALWQDSALAATVRTRTLSGTLVSNLPDAVLFLTNHSARDVPDTPTLRRLASSDDGVSVIWFQNEDSGPRTDLIRMQRELGLTPVHTVRDGAIYRLTAP